MQDVTIRRLVPADAVQYRALMLDAYERHPEAFTSSPAERSALPLAWWEARLDPAPSAPMVVLGGFAQDLLVGTVGLDFEVRIKTRHKALLFGMMVAPAWRGRGLGRDLVQAALALARLRPGVILVQLTVTETNREARMLYERCGFVEFGVEPRAVAVGGMFVAKSHLWCDLRPPENVSA
ncbi:MAG: GNAT family N-acetyltransferase [Casimicrobiaceae bacterium]